MECRMIYSSVFLLLVFVLNSAVQCHNRDHSHDHHHGRNHDHGNSNNNNNDIVVTTNLGKIRGSTMKSRLGKSFYAFRGIRYAKAPVGELRFQAPEPIAPWSDVLDATEDGPKCPQPLINGTDISEDCLRLNVYTSELPSETNPVLKPVVFYMHPGGFYVLTGQSSVSGPQSLMDRDIVLVTINYRLGTLGYLATGTKDAPGNAGFKDQVMAMKWVKQHISKFGGDPNSVTLVGYSAGAYSITLHLVSPMSKDLFHKAVVMSASAITQYEIPTSQIDLAKRQAGLVGCPQNNIDNMVKCLKRVDFRKYAETLGGMFEYTYGYGMPILVWKPVIEPDFGQPRFLTQDPTTSYLNGDFMKIPIISGITKDEFAEPAVAILKNDTIRKEFDENFDKLAPVCFLYERDTPRSLNITRTLRSTFLGNEALSLEKSLQGLHHLFADSVIGFAIHRFVHLAAKHTTVYYYRFSYQGRYSFFYYPENKPFGVVHHDDLLYLLYIPPINPLFTKNDPEDTTVERLTRMWTHFAKTGNPNKPNDEYLRDLRWRPFNSRQENYLDIGDSLVMKQNLYTDRYAVWDRLFPLKN